MKAFQTIAKEIVLASIDMDYVKECGHTTVAQVYQSEYGYNGVSAKACKDYLQGLPSVCSVPFWNDEILEKLRNEGWIPEKAGCESLLIDRYWNVVGNQFCKLIQSGK